MNTMTNSLEAAIKLFPDDIFLEQEENIFVSENRIPKNKNQKAVFEKELRMARIAAANGFCVCLLSEKSEGKNPDSIMNGEITEFKNVTGNIKSVGKRFNEAMKQGKNVFLCIDSEVSIHEVYKKICGEIKANKYTNGTIFVFCKKMYMWKIENLLEKCRK